MKVTLEDIQKIKIELDIIQKANKEKEEKIKTLRSTEGSLNFEKKEAEENLNKITERINDINEKISQLQTNIGNKEKLTKASEIQEIERENKEIDVKTIQYLKAAESQKKRRFAEKARTVKQERALNVVKLSQKRNTYDLTQDSDNSQDSMLLPKKKKTV
ncbi:hypothetical protein WA026_013663 [Henosepilachna vigintioctopunctata]|uniref:Uncharacterized protein n=1 Tax=Henosepilachna vigintioctopunctata TaxID=420089 RepID=A0AAW1V1Q3_9CUCU